MENERILNDLQRLKALLIGLLAALCLLSLLPSGLALPPSSDLEVIPAKPVVETTKDSFEVRDGIFNFSSFLLEDRSLLIAARLIHRPRRIRSSLRGQELYRKMISHFGQRNISSITGDWRSGTNFDAYKMARAHGYSKEAAAKSTWSGKMLSLIHI